MVERYNYSQLPIHLKLKKSKIPTIVEKEQETQMDIDPETLRKFTKDDDKVDSWTAFTSKFIPMTQTVFRGKTKQNVSYII